jgi:excisionase family DNA binding protein
MARPTARLRRGIKLHRNYTVDEAARTLGISKGTVRRWIRSGLPVLADQKPALILGADLLEFMKARSRPAQKCAPHECYCVKCREPRAPAGNIAELIPLTVTGGNLRALCPVCATLMHKRVAVSALDALNRILDVKRLAAPNVSRKPPDT